MRIQHTTPLHADVTVYGSLFFGAVGKLDALGELARNAPSGCAVHLHTQRLIALDTTGLDSLKEIAHTLHKRGCTLHMHHVQAQPLSLLQRSGFLATLHSWDAEHSNPEPKQAQVTP